MFTGDELSALLHAVVSGYPDRARNLVLTSQGLEEAQRDRLWPLLQGDASPAEDVRGIGDALREMGADRGLVNECYRAAFYVGGASADLADNPLYSYFLSHRSGRLLDKWVHYFPIYDRHLAPWRGRSSKVLEIGVYQGGSLEMWRRYLGQTVRLVGIDIDPTALQLANDSFAVMLGDQADPTFLASVVERHGPFDIIIDDGGHTMEQQIASIETLFPSLSDGGVYIVEDCHTSYWEEFGGGLRREGSFVEWSKARIDDLHGYHQPAPVHETWTNHVDGIHWYDSVVVIDKRRRQAPFNEQVGASEFLYFQRPTSVLVGEILATRDAAIAQAEEQASPVLDELRAARGELGQLTTRARESEAELARLRSELDVTRNDLLESWAQVKAMRRTVSWRLTAPLRAVRRRGRSKD